MRKTQDFNLGRILRLPVPVSFLCAVNAVYIVVNEVLLDLWLETHRLPIVVWQLLAATAILVLAAALAGVIWCLGLKNIRNASFKVLQSLFQAVKKISRMKTETSTATISSHHKWWNLGHCSHSWRYQHLVILYTCVYLYSIDIHENVIVPELWAVRVVGLLVLVLLRDKPADFGELEATGAGFGLL
eukprot:scaffold318823_cov47-Prasinocladus_malaysianus.AAC.1